MATGTYQFETIKPGAVPAHQGGTHAPHLSLWIVARGINLGLHTRAYFPEDTSSFATDPILSRIEHQSRVATLIAAETAPGAYRFDIHLQGPSETIFFDI